MSAIIMVFGAVVVLSSVTVLSRQNIKRYLRQRKTSNILSLVRQVADK